MLRRHQPVLRLGQGPPPAHAYHETVIYEAHVKGLTELTPTSPRRSAARTPASRTRRSSSTCTRPRRHRARADAGAPVRPRLTPARRGCRNYWGYNTIGFFAPHNGYAAYGTRGEQVAEFKGMVKALHEADIEVILDVVYNHTAEGNHLGPTRRLPGHRPLPDAASGVVIDGD